METPEVEPQVTSRPAALEAEHGARERVLADMLEHDVDALLLRQLADDALEAVGSVVDDVIGAERLRRFDLLVGADRRDHRRAVALGQLDRGRADAGAAGMDEDGLAGLELGVVEQHVSTVPKVTAPARRPPRRSPEGPAREDARQVDTLLREAVEMEAVHAADMLAEIVAALAAGVAEPAVRAP